VGPRAEDDVIVADLALFPHAAGFVLDHPHLILEKTWQHVLLSGVSLVVAIAIALPLGVWLGHVHRGSLVAVNVANVGRALPSLVLIGLGVVVLGVGFTNVAVALVVLAVPPILTNSYVAVDGVEADAVEAAQGMGMTPWQVLWRVELPLSLPLIFAGIRTAAVFVIATATIAAVAGGGGLGDIIVNQASYELEGVIGAAICVSLLAFAADFGLGALQRLLTPRGLRDPGHALEPDVGTGVGR